MQVRTCQTEQLPRVKPPLPGSFSPVHTRGQNFTHNAAGQNTQSIALATTHNSDVASKTPRREHGEVSNQSLNPLHGKPCEEGMACMHAPCMAECPSLHPRLRDVAQVRLHALAMPNCS